MASLQARTPLRNIHPLLVINKLLSLTAFMVLLVVGWLALSYLKAEMSARRNAVEPAPAAAPVEAKEKAVRLDQSRTPQVQKLSNPVKLVYSCEKDREYYHTSNHLPSRCERVALSEDAALKRNLKPCPVCMPQ